MAADQVAIATPRSRHCRTARRTDDQSADQHASRILNARSRLNSGFMIAQVTAAALTSENRALPHRISVDSISTSGNQEDYVSWV